jgi:hypothetical protein
MLDERSHYGDVSDRRLDDSKQLMHFANVVLPRGTVRQSVLNAARTPDQHGHEWRHRKFSLPYNG